MPRLIEENEQLPAPTTPSETTSEELTPADERLILRRIRTLISRQSFSGPMPPPECLQQYDQIVPGAAKEIIEEFKANGAHQRAMDQAILKATSSQDKRAQWMAYSLVFLGFILIMALAHTGHDWVAGTVSVTLLGAVAANFLQGKEPKTSPPPKENSKENSTTEE